MSERGGKAELCLRACRRSARPTLRCTIITSNNICVRFLCGLPYNIMFWVVVPFYDVRIAYLGAYIWVRTLCDVRMYDARICLPGSCCYCCFLHITIYILGESINRWWLLHRWKNCAPSAWLKGPCRPYCNPIYFFHLFEKMPFRQQLYNFKYTRGLWETPYGKRHTSRTEPVVLQA